MIPFSLPSSETASRIIGTALLLLAPILVMRSLRTRAARREAGKPEIRTGDFVADTLLGMVRSANKTNNDAAISSTEIIVWITALSLIIVLWY